MVHLAGDTSGAWAGTYGAFEPGGRYRINNPKTPRPWINILANERYGVVLSQAGSGFSWYGDCQSFRISRWYQDLVSDPCGRYIYVLDRAKGTVLSTSYLPTRAIADEEEIVHEVGSTTFRRRFGDLRTEHTVCVPPESSCELWLIRFSNDGLAPLSLRIASYFELHLGSVGDTHREFHRLFMESAADGDTMLAWKHLGLREGAREPSGSTAHVAIRWIGTQDVAWVSDKEAWLGRLGTPVRPEGLLVPPTSKGSARWDDPVSAGWFDLELAPGAVAEYALVVGAADDAEAARALVQRHTVESVCDEVHLTRQFWRSRCNALHIESGLPDMDELCNYWLPYQAIAGRMLARCAYYQQGGAYGYRDQLQDSLMALASEPQTTLQQLERHAESMRSDGSVLHWWFPVSGVGVDSHHSDTCLWLTYGVLSYLDETADLSILSTRVPWLSGGEASLLDHCLAGIDRALELRSARGLPLMGAGDWNDGLSHVGIDGVGESVWVGMFLYHILERLVPYLNRAQMHERAETYRLEAENLALAVNSYAWETDRFIAGTDDLGRPFGSSGCSAGRLFLNMQTWSTIAGIGTEERRAIALATVRESLVQDYGALLLRPAYSKVDPYIGYISRYAPGLRENGGVYSHASTWAVQAFAMAKDDETAYRVFRGMCPSVRSSKDADLYAAEPYVMPGNIDGPDSPYEGRAGWTWYTGSAAWMRRVFVDWIVGVRATYEGLLVEPCLPVELPVVKLRRPFRGDVYEITTHRGARCLGPLVGPGTGQTIEVEARP